MALSASLPYPNDAAPLHSLTRDGSPLTPPALAGSRILQAQIACRLFVVGFNVRTAQECHHRGTQWPTVKTDRGSLDATQGPADVVHLERESEAIRAEIGD